MAAKLRIVLATAGFASALGPIIPARGPGSQVPLKKIGTDSFSWESTSPAEDIDFSPCYDGLQCARLSVPLNWNSTGTERQRQRAAVAIVRLPAKVPVTDERHGGMIVINPGGPGESGVDQLLSRGRAIQTIVDASSSPEATHNHAAEEKYFDIVGFDPRGVKYTTPSLHCFPDAFSQQVWLLSRPEFGYMFDSDSAFAFEWARTESLGHSCSANGKGVNMLPYANTAQTVEDMLAIVNGYEEWRKTGIEHHSESNQYAANTPSQIRGKEKLQYWGVSYGTMLGQTFAAMHPDRVGHLVIDGVLDPDDYYKGHWLANLQDSDKVMSKLSEYCFRAGPKHCPLHDASAQAIEDRINQLVFGLKTNPIAAVTEEFSAGVYDPVVVTFDDFYLRGINALAFPKAAAEDFFRILAELERGNITEIVHFKQEQLDVAASLAECRDQSSGCMPERYFGLLGPTPAIECMDSAASRDESLTKQYFMQYFEALSRQSKWFSLAWARHRMSCIGFRNGPVWTYDGSISGNTSHPLLIIGNTHDTVTPLRNAHRVSALFLGSVVLQQNSEGHCSHANPSMCTSRHVRHYFQTGELPEPGTVCQPDWLPFLGARDNAKAGLSDNTTSDDIELEMALLKLAEPLPPLSHW